MKCEMRISPDDNSLTRFWVGSESESGVEYLVDLAAIPVGINRRGTPVYNGACIGRRSETEWDHHGCKHFQCVQGPALRNPLNKGRTFRCKHILCARKFIEEAAVDGMIQQLKVMNPNLDEDEQT